MPPFQVLLLLARTYNLHTLHWEQTFSAVPCTSVVSHEDATRVRAPRYFSGNVTSSSTPSKPLVAFFPFFRANRGYRRITKFRRLRSTPHRGRAITSLVNLLLFLVLWDPYILVWQLTILSMISQCLTL